MKPTYNDHDADDMKRPKKMGSRMSKMARRKKAPMEARPMNGPYMDGRKKEK